jgi:hypothetical protein
VLLLQNLLGGHLYQHVILHDELPCVSSVLKVSRFLLTSSITWRRLLTNRIEETNQDIVDLIMGLRSFHRVRLGHAIGAIGSARSQTHGGKWSACSSSASGTPSRRGGGRDVLLRNGWRGSSAASHLTRCPG